MLNFRQLKSFLVVAEKKSFTKAAKELFMTQPAISAQIKTLEEFLDIQLIERLDKKVILTEAGETFIKETRKIITIYEEATMALQEIKGVQKGKLIIGASTIPGEYILPRYIGAFKKDYPKIDIALKISDTGAVVETLKERKIDIGVIGAKVKDKDIVFREFLSDELIVIAHPTNPLVGKEVSLSEIIASPMILRETSSGTRMVIIRHLQGKNIAESDLNIVMELGSTRAVITAIEANLGISLVSKWAAEEALSLKKITQLHVPDMEIKRSLYIVTHRTKYARHAAKRFMEFLNDQSL